MKKAITISIIALCLLISADAFSQITISGKPIRTLAFIKANSDTLEIGKIVFMATLKLRVKQKAKVKKGVSNTRYGKGHGFSEGEIVRVVEKLDNNTKNAHYRCEHLDGSDYWFLSEQDLKPLTKKK